MVLMALFDYQSLIRKLPNNWKNIIINNKQVCIQTKYNVTCNIFVKYLLKDKQGCIEAPPVA